MAAYFGLRSYTIICLDLREFEQVIIRKYDLLPLQDTTLDHLAQMAK